MIHGFSAVAELKLPNAGGYYRWQDVIHGFSAVAELKLLLGCFLLCPIA